MKINNKFFEVFIIFILSLTPLLWLHGNYVILGHDSGFRLDPVSHLKNLFYSWDPSYNFGLDWSSLKGFLVTQAPEALFTVLMGSISSGQTITFIFWFFTIGISMYALINTFFPEGKYRVFRIFSSIFYMYNFFLLQAWFIAERAKFSLFAALPIGLLILYKTLTKDYSLKKGLIFFSLTFFFLNGGGSPPFYGTLLVAYSVTFFYLTVYNIREHGYKELIYSLKVGLLLIAGFSFVNAYWLLPQLYLFINNYSSTLSGLGGVTGIISWESSISQYASLINLFRLQGIPDWYNNVGHSYANEFIKNPILILLSFTPFFIILLGLYLHAHKRIIGHNHKLFNLILLLFMISFLFTGGTHPPLGFLYEFFIRHIPGFAIFRTPFYKFGPLLWFSFIFLTGFFLNFLLLTLVKKKILYRFLGVIALLGILAYHYPFFTKTFFEWKTPFTTKVQVPDYASRMAEYIDTTEPTSRILLLPKLDPEFNSDIYNWGFWSLDVLPRLFTNRSIIANTSNFSTVVSSIYEAISRNEENTFFRLAGIAGIDRILWRNDVPLPRNASSNEKNIDQKKNLENFTGITKEKTYGAWTLYKINSFSYLPSFYAADGVIYAKSDSTILRDILMEDKLIKRPTVLFSQPMIDKDQRVLSILNKNIIQPECALCSPDDLNKLKGGPQIPEVSLLPDSPFYFLVTWREQKILSLYKTNPVFMIDADLGLSNKRIAEMKKITMTKLTQNSRTMLNQVIKRYKSLITDVINQTSLLPEDQTNAAFIKIQSFLNSQYGYLAQDSALYEFDSEGFENLSIFMQNQIADLQSKSWFTNMQEYQIKYLLPIDVSGIYDLHIIEEKIQPKKIEIDGRLLLTNNNLFLTKGIHKLSVIYPNSGNFLTVKESQELTLPFGKKIKFAIKNYDTNNRYIIHFEYRIIKGRANASIVQGGKKSYHRELLHIGQTPFWKSRDYLFQKPSVDSTYAQLEFYQTGFETEDAVVQVKNLDVVKYIAPNVFLSRKRAAVNIRSPKLSFQRINPTKYIIHVTRAEGSFILNFGDSFHEGWKAYIMPGAGISSWFSSLVLKPIPETQHYLVNGYANGWYINKSGDYSILIEYYPQKVFYAGLLLSGLSVIFSILFLVKRRKNG